VAEFLQVPVVPTKVGVPEAARVVSMRFLPGMLGSCATANEAKPQKTRKASDRVLKATSPGAVGNVEAGGF
jgi:hypothetical protein